MHPALVRGLQTTWFALNELLKIAEGCRQQHNKSMWAVGDEHKSGERVGVKRVLAEAR
jgi:hypothetical protein